MEYHEIAQGGKALGETNDCGVVTVAAICDIPYAEAHALLKERGRPDRRGTPHAAYLGAIRHMGFDIAEISVKSKTVRTIERELADNWGGVKVMILVTRHILAWDGFKIVDWSAGRTKRITTVWTVAPVGTDVVGRSVPRPIQRAHKVTARATSAVSMTLLGGATTEHNSLAAAYKYYGLHLKGHQRIRRIVKQRGEWVFYGWQLVPERNLRRQVHITIKLL